jgi:TrmH family RNA methyltransferase
LANVRVVLVRPGSPANVGAAARAVRNTGLTGLDLVSPGDWRTLECWRTAWKAHEVLEAARVFEDVRAAVADATWVVGLSGRAPAGVPALEARAMAQEVAGLGPEDRVALVFGPENSGLSDEELDTCGRRAFIPSHPDQPSLNLSHAVMVVAYEVYRAGRLPPAQPRRATAAEKEALLDLWRDGLQAIEALPPRNAESAWRAWRTLILRADLTPREVRLLEHAARKMTAAARSASIAARGD